jgi:hypothetical protein
MGGYGSGRMTVESTREWSMDKPGKMLSAAEEKLSNKDKIAVLMGEYSSLRAEVHHRLTSLLTFTGTGITVAIALVGAIIAQPTWVALYVLLVVAISLYVGFAVLMDYNVYQITKRIRELEAQINLCAGERLLKWETDHGLGSVLQQIWKR